MKPPAEPVPLLSTTGLCVSFVRGGRKATVVERMDYRLASGTTLAIVGESGAGKTVSCRALLGLLPADAIVSGSARFEGRELLGLTESEMRRYRGRRISMVFQDPSRSLNPTMRVGEQIAETIREHEHADWPRARTRAIELMDVLRLGAPETVYRFYPHQLSGGMQQRIAIAMALAGKPQLLIADEATRSLDATTQGRIVELLMDLQEQSGMAIILITHDLGLAAACADDVLVMKAGRTVEYGSADLLLERPRMPYTQALIRAAGSVGRPTVPIDAAGGADPPPRAASPAQPPAPLLSVRDVIQEYRTGGWWSGQYGVVRAVAGVSFDLHPGEALGLVGETGCGKSTLARTLLLEPPPVSGSVCFAGIELTRLRPRALAATRRDIQMVFQDPYGSLNPTWTVASIVEEPLLGVGVARSERRRRVGDVLDLVELPYAEYGRRRPREMSGGQRQRVAIARALAPSPSLIVLDEALSSLDAVIQRQILDLLQRLRSELGVAMLIISHDLAHVRDLCDRVAVMHEGRIRDIGPAEALCGSALHPSHPRSVRTGRGDQTDLNRVAVPQSWAGIAPG